jgi:hypothetical protein
MVFDMELACSIGIIIEKSFDIFALSPISQEGVIMRCGGSPGQCPPAMLLGVA